MKFGLIYNTSQILIVPNIKSANNLSIKKSSDEISETCYLSLNFQGRLED